LIDKQNCQKFKIFFVNFFKSEKDVHLLEVGSIKVGDFFKEVNKMSEKQTIVRIGVYICK